MMFPINYAAVVVAAVVSMVLGSLWYGPLFGKMWMAFSGITPGQIDAAKKAGMAKSYALAFVGSLLMAYVLAHALLFASSYLKVSGIVPGLTSGFWNWLGFVAPVTLGTVLWEGKSWKLWFLSNSYYLVSLQLMGAILSLWP